MGVHPNICSLINVVLFFQKPLISIFSRSSLIDLHKVKSSLYKITCLSCNISGKESDFNEMSHNASHQKSDEMESQWRKEVVITNCGFAPCVAVNNVDLCLIHDSVAMTPINVVTLSSI